MRYTPTRFEQVPLEVVRKIVAESAKRSSSAHPLRKRKAIVKHPPVSRRGVKW